MGQEHSLSFLNDKDNKMEYTYENKNNDWNGNLEQQVCMKISKPLETLQNVFNEMKKEYINERNELTDGYIEEYGDDGITMMEERFPKPINIDELTNQAKIISKKYEIYGTTKYGSKIGFLFKIPNVRVRCRTYINLGDYYCWFYKWGMNDMRVEIYQAYEDDNGIKVFNYGQYQHPHISGRSPCLGSYESPIRNCSGHFNIVGLINNVKSYLNSYYGRSVYQAGSYYKPINISVPNLDMIETWKGRSFNFRNYKDYYHKDFAYRPGDKEYKALIEEWNSKFFDKKHTVTISPNVLWYYLRRYGVGQAYYGADANAATKTMIVLKHFNLDNYWKAFCVLAKYLNNVKNQPSILTKLSDTYQNIYAKMIHHVINYKETEYYIGYGRGRVTPDTAESEIMLVKNVSEIKDILQPSSSNVWDRFYLQGANDFYKEISEFKTIEDLHNQEEDRESKRIGKALKLIDETIPKYKEWRDAYSRKIIIHLDKEKRRLTNGLNNIIQNSNANQLSFEAFSRD